MNKKKKKLISYAIRPPIIDKMAGCKIEDICNRIKE